MSNCTTQEIKLTYEEIVEIINSITFLGFRFELETSATGYALTDQIILHSKIDLPSNDTDRRTINSTSTHSDLIKAYDLDSKESLLSRIRSGLSMWAKHEVDELFLVNGVAIFNPHDERVDAPTQLLNEITSISKAKWYQRFSKSFKYLMVGKIK